MDGLWHPTLLARAQALPEWKRADHSSLDLENSLIVCPASKSDVIDITLAERLDTQGCLTLYATDDRSEVVASLIQGMEGEQHEGLSGSSATSPRTIAVEDFYALGFGFLMLQALTRKVSYSSNIDVVMMADQAKSAALAFLSGDEAECERWLQSCFDQLSQERDRYFTQAANLLDLTLLAPSTLGRSLEEQLESASSHPMNVLASASLLKRLAQSNPTVWQGIVEGQAMGRIGIIGGLEQDRSYHWLPLGTLQRDLQRGAHAYQELQLAPPRVFAQFDGSMTSEMPTHLKSAGYTGVLLHAFTTGSYPVTSQAKISWEASDVTAIDAISSAVLDVASTKSVFNAINELAKQFDHHQVPTLTCVHWPSRRSVAYDDLVRATRRTNAFGEWKTLEDYFSSTGFAYTNDRFSISQFKTPWPTTYADYSRKCDALLRCLRRNTSLEATRQVAVVVDQILATLPDRENRQAALEPIRTELDG